MLSATDQKKKSLEKTLLNLHLHYYFSLGVAGTVSSIFLSKGHISQQ